MHYSFRKAGSILGVGNKNIGYVETDLTGKLSTKSLVELIKTYNDKKVLILAIIGIAGTTETGQIDPLNEMAKISSEYNIHFHVDAAWGGATIFSDKNKYKLDGIEKADSISLCGHKQLYLPMGISICLFKNQQVLDLIQVNSNYQGIEGSFDTGQYTIEGSRSAISLTLHAALNLLGKKGYEALINNSINKANYFSLLIQRLDSFELIGKPELNIVNYRYIPQKFRDKIKFGNLSDKDNQTINKINSELQKALFIKGKSFISKTTLNNTKHGKDKPILVLRVVFSNPLTNSADIYTVIEDQLNIACELFNEKPELNFNENFKLTSNLTQNLNVDYSSITNINFQGDNNLSDNKQTILIGKPIYNTTIYILDKYKKALPIGIAGEIYVGGMNLAAGYIENIDLTNEKFVNSPFKHGEKLYKTGDLARWLPDGNIEYLGRIDDQIKIRGFRIEIGDVEGQLMLHENIKETVIIAREDNEGNKYLCSYIVAERKLSTRELRDYLSKKLPDYMVPSFFLQLEKMPLTPTEKIDKKALPIPNGSVNIGVEYVAPRNSLDFEIQKIWQEIFGIKKIGINDSFFELGGHSFKAMIFLNKLSAIVGKVIPVKTVFNLPTISQLSNYLINELQINTFNTEELQQKKNDEIVEGEVFLIPNQYLILSRSYGDIITFTMPMIIYRKEGFDTEIVRNVLNKIAAHHDAIRIVFKKDGNKVTQYNKGICDNMFDFSEIPLYNKNKEQIIEDVRWYTDEMKRGVDPENGPLMKFILFKTDEGDHLAMSITHLIGDLSSMIILLEDFARGYNQAVKNELISFPQKTTSLKKWGDFIKEYSQSKKLLEEVDYWNSILIDYNDFLPRDHQITEDKVRDQRIVAISISAEDTKMLMEKIRNIKGCTINILLQAALSLALKKWTGVSRFVIELLESGREKFNEFDLSKTFAWVNYSYPVMVDISQSEDSLENLNYYMKTMDKIPCLGIGLRVLQAYKSHLLLPMKVKQLIQFNFLGVLDDIQIENNLFTLSDLEMGDISGDDKDRYQVLEFIGMVKNGQISITVKYNMKEFDEVTMQNVLGYYKESILEILKSLT
jgi:non-ribosomal peptide synthase protein (TIGR01720 family)